MEESRTDSTDIGPNSEAGDDCDPAANAVFVPRESARGVQVEMLWSPDGPDATAESEYRGLAWGSAFMNRVAGQDFLVTARHNLTGRHWLTNQFLSGISTEPTHLKVVLLPKDLAKGISIQPSEEDPRLASMEFGMPMYTLPLIGEDWRPIWKQHPRLGAEMDVAALPFRDDRGYSLITSWEPPTDTPAEIGVRWPRLTAGQDVFIVGYPLGLVSGPMLPLWMRGAIASEPALGHWVDGKARPLMIVDARTRKGSSGSAVIRHHPEGAIVMRTDGQHGTTLSPQSQIIGVYSGRTHSDSDLGYVWRIDEVDRICRDGVPGTI